MVVIDAQGLVQGWNGIAGDLFGWQEAEVRNRPAVDLLVPDRLKPAFSHRLSILSRNDRDDLIGTRFEVMACRRDGREMPVELGLMAMTAEDGTKLLIGSVRDLTQQHRAIAESQARTAELLKTQEQLKRSEELYRQVIELSNLIPWTADVQGRVDSIGRQWEERTGVPVRQALGSAWLQCVHPEDLERVVRTWQQAVRSGNRLSIEWRLRTKDGQYRWYHGATSRLTRLQKGDAVWFGTLEDIHERKMVEEASSRAQAELVHVSRLSAMGAMATIIAHDLNQPLTAAAQYVRGSRNLIRKEKSELLPEIVEALDAADGSIVRASEIVRRVREFVSRGNVECAHEEVADLIEEACRFALTDARTRGISYNLDLQARCPVMVDRIQIQQVLVNLLRNAVDALDGQPRREIVIRTAHERPDFCTVSVCDTGSGIAPEVAARMFDPFFSTRTSGMGIGLSIGRMIIEAHGGTIWNASVSGDGTTINFTLPMVRDRLSG